MVNHPSYQTPAVSADWTSSRNYQTPAVSADWTSSRETHMVVATAIHALASSARSPEAIWEAPTSAEWDNVAMAVEDYVTHGDFPASDDGNYAWGAETIHIAQREVSL